MVASALFLARLRHDAERVIRARMAGGMAGGGARSGATCDDHNAASRDAGTREPGGHPSGVF